MGMVSHFCAEIWVGEGGVAKFM